MDGRYQIRKKIGTGNFGKIFLARDVINKSNTNKRVAIKVLKDEMDDSEDEDGEMLVFKSLQKNQKLDSRFLKGLPLIIDSGLSQMKEEYFIMERLGVSLVDVIKRNKLKFSYEQIVPLGI